MTAMINQFATKKEMIAAIAGGIDPHVSDPSFFAPFEGKLSVYMANKAHAPFVLDHPRRFKFAEVNWVGGKLVAS